MLAAMPDETLFFKVAPRAVQPTAAFGNRADVVKADIRAGAKMSARAKVDAVAKDISTVGGAAEVAQVDALDEQAVAKQSGDVVMQADSA